MLPARKRVYTIGELVLCNCTERAEGDKMGGGAREEKIGCGQKQLLMLQVSTTAAGCALPCGTRRYYSANDVAMEQPHQVWRALQGSGEYSCEDSRHPRHSSSSSSILRAMNRQWLLYSLASCNFYLQSSVQSLIESSILQGVSVRCRNHSRG